MTKWGLLLDGKYRENVLDVGVWEYVEKYVRTKNTWNLKWYLMVCVLEYLHTPGTQITFLKICHVFSSKDTHQIGIKCF